ncbi:hypothetical protein, conserved [Eimeria praecox]|uniref:Uncharacterized protein n=1 Tax=Eimeria praecox TaxID=51316 RepID=U6GSK4_9EIME|nr:hypothetical protein, conserved [Eimeria praecox]
MANESSSVATRTQVPPRASATDDSLITAVVSTASTSTSPGISEAPTTSSGTSKGVATARRSRRSTAAATDAAAPTSSIRDGLQNASAFSGDEEHVMEESSVEAEEGTSQRSRSFGPGTTRSPSQGGPLASRLPRSTPATSEEQQVEGTQVSTTAPGFSAGITTAFTWGNSRGEIISSRGRVFRGSEFASEEADGPREENTCTLGHCPSPDFLGTAATPRTAGRPSGQHQDDDPGSYMGELLSNGMNGEKDLHMGVLQPEHFVLDSDDSDFPKFIHGIIPEHSRESPKLDASLHGNLSSRRLGERPSAQEAGTPRAAGRREASGGAEKKPSEAKESKPEAKAEGKKAGKDEEEDPFEEYPDHCGDIATFIEGRQVVEWDIPIFNGIVHVLGSSVLRPDIEAIATEIAFWQCTHQFCFECPFLTPFLLKFLDKIGIITGKNPFEFMPPPGVRPDWVCRGAFDYYPAGWTKQSWLKYLETMHSSDKRIMKKNAELVARAAHERHQIALLYESVRLQSIEARRRYDPLRPISDPFYDPQYKNMKKSYDEKHFECKGEVVNREMTHKQMHKVLPAVYPWKG